jgi:hypothetical protein
MIRATAIAMVLAFPASLAGGELEVSSVRLPAIVFGREKNNVCVTVSNGTALPVRIAASVTLRPEGGREETSEVTFEARAGQEDAALVAFDMTHFPKRTGSIAVSVKAGAKQLFSGDLRVVDSVAGLSGLKVKGGVFFDEKDRRCLVCTVEEDQAKYREWALVKWVARKADRSAKKALVLGSRMVNSPDDGDGRYAAALRKLFDAGKHSLHFAVREDASFPVLADVVKAGELMKEHKPGVFVYCPGVEDLEKGVPVRLFSRAVDVLIDQVRRGESPPRVVLVTPVPYLSDMKLWGEYADAMRRVAREHHTDIVDLRAALGGDRRTYERFFAQQEGSRVFLLYPGKEGQEAIARAIMRYVY